MPVYVFCNDKIIAKVCNSVTVSYPGLQMHKVGNKCDVLFLLCNSNNLHPGPCAIILHMDLGVYYIIDVAQVA